MTDNVTPAVSITGLTVQYGKASASLRDVSFNIATGQIVSVLGSNGAGKTTLLRALSGALGHYHGRVVAGSITVAGQQLTKARTPAFVRAGVCHVPEGRRVFGRLTVQENLRASATGLRRTDYQAGLERVHALFPALSRLADRRGSLLSGGEQQMLAIGRALVRSPSLLLLDEPSLGLAPIIIKQIAAAIVRINAEGTTVLLAEQNAAVALSIADEALVLDVGRVAAHDSAQALSASDTMRSVYFGAPVPTDGSGVGADRTQLRPGDATSALPHRSSPELT